MLLMISQRIKEIEDISQIITQTATNNEYLAYDMLEQIEKIGKTLN